MSRAQIPCSEAPAGEVRSPGPCNLALFDDTGPAIAATRRRGHPAAALLTQTEPAKPRAHTPRPRSQRDDDALWAPLTPRARAAAPEDDETRRFDTNGTSEVEPIEERCSSLLRVNDAADLPFALAINPYRGCPLDCVFCPSALHVEDTRWTSAPIGQPEPKSVAVTLHAKVNAAARLQEELASPRYQPRPINLGSAADVYQPAERRLRLTRGILEILHETGHPVAIVTRSTGIARDVDLLKAMATRQQVLVMISLCTHDEELARLLEPHAPTPRQRLATMRRLTRAGVPVTLNLAPVIPGLTEAGLEDLVAAAALAGATTVRHQVLTLSSNTAVRLGHTISLHEPDQAEAILSRIHELCCTAEGMTASATANHAAATWACQIAQRVSEAAAANGLATELPVLSGLGFHPPVAVVSNRSQPIGSMAAPPAHVCGYQESQSCLF